MKRITILLSVMVVASLILFTSCKKDEDVTPGIDHSNFSVEDHKKELANNTTTAIEEMEALNNSVSADASKSMGNLMSINDPLEGTQTNKVQSIIDGINKFTENPAEKDLLLKSLEEGGFQFPYDEFVGEYTWNPSTQSWDKAVSSQIVFKFPATENGTENNAVLTFASYTDQKFIIDLEAIYLPTSASINLTVDGTKELELTFSAAYKVTGIPETVDVTLFVNPFTLSLSLKNTNTVLSAEYKWTKENTNIISFGSTWNGDFSTLDFSDNGDDPTDKATTASAYVQLFDARLEVTANVEELRKFEEPTIEQVNANSTITLIWANDNVKIADGEIKQENDEDIFIMLTFTDGTTADARVFFEDSIKEFEDFFNKLMGEFEDQQ